MKLLFTKALHTVVLCAMPHLAMAECPAFVAQTEPRQSLLENLARSTNQAQGRDAANALWLYWHKAPDETAQELLNAGVTAIRYGDYLRAEDVLSRLVTYCPTYSEGYNQLAFAYFLQRRDAPSLDLLEKALALEPAHFGALSGIGLIHIRAGKPALGQIFLRRAVAINPWLNERSLLEQSVEGGMNNNEL